MVHTVVPPMGLQTPSAPWGLSLASPLGTLCSVQWLSENIPLCICQALEEPLAILTGLRLNDIVVLICISFISNDVEHFFMCFSAIHYILVENSLFSSVPHLNRVVWFSGV